MRIAPAPTQNVQLVTTSPIDGRGVYRVETTAITFGADYTGGGFVVGIPYRSGQLAGPINARRILGSPAERAAAQAVQDAITGSGILQLAVPTTDKTYARPGWSRLYLDRRQWVVEYPTATPPAGVQSVLDAIAAWSRLS